MSHTISAIFIQLAVVILPAIGIQVGSDQLTNLVQTVTVILTGLYVWYRRVQKGDVTLAGVRQ